MKTSQSDRGFLKGEQATPEPGSAGAFVWGWKLLFSNFAAASVSAFVMLSFSVSYGVMVFSDPLLKQFLPWGIYASLVTTFVLLIVNSTISSFEFSLAGPDSNSTVLLSLMASSIAIHLVQDKADAGMMLGTILMTFAVAAIFVGCLAFLLGRFKLGKNIGLIPFPVVAGFLAGAGCLVIEGGTKVLTGKVLSITTIGELCNGPWLPLILSLVLATALFILPRKIPHYLTFPLIVAFGIGSYYFLQWVSGSNGHFESLLEMNSGLSMTSLPDTPLPALAIHWDAIFERWLDFFPLAIIVILTSLLNSAGLDIASQEDGDFDRDLRGIGIGLVASGIFGGFLGHTSASRSILHRKAGATSRLSGLFAGIICLIVTYFFRSVLLYFPRPVLAGILLSIGMQMLREWAWESYWRLDFKEYLMVLVTMTFICLKGPLFGVLFGVVMTNILFVFNYSRINCVRQQCSCGERFSNKDRPFQHINILREHGKVSQVLVLQGYLFYGTSNVILAQARVFLEKEHVRFLLLDFRNVQGIDASTVLTFNKLDQMCKRFGAKLIFSSLSPEFLKTIHQGGLKENGSTLIISDLDHGLEWIEEQIIAAKDCQEEVSSIKAQMSEKCLEISPEEQGRTFLEGVPARDGQYPESSMDGTFLEGDSRKSLKSRHSTLEEMDVWDIFSPFQMDSHLLSILLNFCKSLDLDPGFTFFRLGDKPDGMYFIEKGHVAVVLHMPNGEVKRLRTLGPGSILGEMAIYAHKPRSAEAFAETACRVLFLDVESFNRLEKNHPQVSREFHTFIIKNLSFRLVAASSQILALS